MDEAAEETPPLEDTVVLEPEANSPPDSRIGNAASTVAGDKAAMTWANAWLKENENIVSITNLKEIHVEGNNMRRILGAMLGDYANSNIPYSTGGEGLFLKADSKRTYASKIKTAFKNQFPKHSFWNEKDEDGWSALLKQFNKAAKRFDQGNGRQVASRKAFPIYKDLQELPIGAISVPEMAGVIVTDLKGMLMGLLKVASNRAELTNRIHQKRLEILLCKNADGRGGEHYLLKWETAYWDYRLHMPVFNWIIPKQLDEQLMVFAPQKFAEDAYLCDVFHAMGCFFVMEKGASNMDYPPEA